MTRRQHSELLTILSDMMFMMKELVTEIRLLRKRKTR